MSAGEGGGVAYGEPTHIIQSYHGNPDPKEVKIPRRKYLRSE